MAIHKATPGSISHGTMRAEDLIPRFMEVLDELKETASLSVAPGEEARVTSLVKLVDITLGDIEQRRIEMGEEAYYVSEDATFDLEHLFEMLDLFAPDGHHFGAHEGNGADYGFWSVEDFWDEEQEDVEEADGRYWDEPNETETE